MRWFGRWIWRQRMHRAVIVTVSTGHGEFTYRGVLHDQDREALVLRNAGQVDPRSDSQFIPADGELVLEKSKVVVSQFL